jgi:hypothetical protein
MTFFRYRRPSVKTLRGVTRARKPLEKELGVTALLKPLRWRPNEKRKMKRGVGYYSEPGRSIRDGMSKPGGRRTVGLLGLAALIGTATKLLLAVL